MGAPFRKKKNNNQLRCFPLHHPVLPVIICPTTGTDILPQTSPSYRFGITIIPLILSVTIGYNTVIMYLGRKKTVIAAKSPSLLFFFHWKVRGMS